MVLVVSAEEIMEMKPTTMVNSIQQPLQEVVQIKTLDGAISSDLVFD